MPGDDRDFNGYVDDHWTITGASLDIMAPAGGGKMTITISPGSNSKPYLYVHLVCKRPATMNEFQVLDEAGNVTGELLGWNEELASLLIFKGVWYPNDVLYLELNGKKMRIPKPK